MSHLPLKRSFYELTELRRQQFLLFAVRQCEQCPLAVLVLPATLSQFSPDEDHTVITDTVFRSFGHLKPRPSFPDLRRLNIIRWNNSVVVTEIESAKRARLKGTLKCQELASNYYRFLRLFLISVV